MSSRTKTHHWFSAALVVLLVLLTEPSDYYSSIFVSAFPGRDASQSTSRRHNSTSSYARIKGGFTGAQSTKLSRWPSLSSSRRKIITPSSMTVSSLQLSSPATLYKQYHGHEDLVYEVIDGVLVLPSRSARFPSETSIAKVTHHAQHQQKLATSSTTTQRSLPRKLDVALFLTYLCNAMVFTLPVVLLPMLAAEQSPSGVAGLCAAVASVGALGGAAGKFVNGFVCQQAGGRKSSSLYLIGLAACSLFLSCAKFTHVGWAVAGMEFFSSIQWTACTVVLANHYDGDPASFARGITILSFASTAGTLLSKAVGTALLQRFHWRSVAQFGTIVALVGACCMRVLVQEFPSNVPRARLQKERVDIRTIASSLKHVLGSRLFWQAGIAHAMAFLARTSDRVLGTFFQEATSLPRYICGGLTASVTLGFVHGLMTGNAFHTLKDTTEKAKLLKRRYAFSVLSALGLALCANKSVASFLSKSSSLLLATAVALSSGAMASSLSFQFYQLPPTVAKTFGNNKAVCLSFLDGIGFFLAAPIWAITSRIVSHPTLGNHGWSVAWSMLAVLFGVGGSLMMGAVSPLLGPQQKVTS